MLELFFCQGYLGNSGGTRRVEMRHQIDFDFEDSQIKVGVLFLTQ